MNNLRDHMLVGIIIGILVPFFIYIILVSILEYIFDENPLRESTLQLIALFFNLPLFRKLLVDLKKDRLGRGMLFSTFVFAFWFIFYYKTLIFS